MGAFRTSGYDKVLMNLPVMTIELAEAVQKQISLAIETLANKAITQDWEQCDDIIDQMRDNIINRCLYIMSLQQLRSQDLRWILGFQRIAQELERVADYACDITELSDLKADRNWFEDVLQMAEHLLEMMEYTVNVLKGEKEYTEDLADQDDLLDEAYHRLKTALAKGNLTKSDEGQLGISILVARTLERMGDHIVNVAETLFYIKTGKKRLDAEIS
ncbi:phosphate uptake regulator PhoU [Desulfosporosinus sp. FKA]|uniref:phosphate signaling complex PhoU family protein n=1 Tax=Desulfosporosinus sp. FKA TaxID=1969834 RepID=UPI000B497E58|nr:phosphate uptake regulator PhoU [Desulfosporosinus sp. FKA]